MQTIGKTHHMVGICFATLKSPWLFITTAGISKHVLFPWNQAKILYM